jgi:hypothetical protein
MAVLRIHDTDGLAKESRQFLASLAQLPWATDFYLAGSAALTLYLQHRPVRDLDLMSQFRRLRSNERRDLLQDLLKLDGDTRVETARDGFLYVRAASGVGVRLYYYPYPLVQAEESLSDIAVASPIDLGLMKLGAVISRGTRRDFIDLYLLCQEIPLSDLLEQSLGKFGRVGDFPLQALKGLTDFSQIEGEPSPELSRDVQWTEIENWIRRQVRTLGRQWTGLDQNEKE